MLSGSARGCCFVASEDRRSHVDAKTFVPRLRVRGRVFRAACIVAAAIALAACNGSKNAYVPPPPPKVAVAQPLQKPVTALSQPDRQHVALQFGRSRRPRAGLPHRHRLCRRRGGEGGRTSCSASSATSTRRNSTRRRRRSRPIRRRWRTTKPNISARRRSAKAISPARRRCRNGSRKPMKRPREMLNAKAAIETAQDQP